MSLVAVNKLVRDLERRSGAAEDLKTDAEAYLSGFALSDAERDAVLDLDAAALVDLGVHPLLMRSLLVVAGVANPDIYTHDQSLRTRTERT